MSERKPKEEIANMAETTNLSFIVDKLIVQTVWAAPSELSNEGILMLVRHNALAAIVSVDGSNLGKDEFEAIYSITSEEATALRQCFLEVKKTRREQGEEPQYFPDSLNFLFATDEDN